MFQVLSVASCPPPMQHSQESSFNVSLLTSQILGSCCEVPLRGPTINLDGTLLAY